MNLWVYFWIFTVSNGLLSYFPIPLEFKGWIFVLGLVLPWIILLKGLLERPEDKPSFFGKDHLNFGTPSPFFWVVFLGLAFFLRFYKLTSFYFWPVGDEGQNGFLAIDLAQKWTWQFFYTMGEHPPLWTWILRVFFQDSRDSFFNLWFPPAFLSFLNVPLAYFAARCFFPRSLSLLFGGLMAFSFWPLYAGRFCHQGMLIPFWTLSSLLLWGLLLGEKRAGVQKFFMVALGLWVGLGSLTFPSWSTVLLLMVITVGTWSVHGGMKRVDHLFYFLASLLLGLTPFLTALFVYRDDFGHHLVNVFQGRDSLAGHGGFLAPLSYITALFWGLLQHGSSYTPVWGGALNPLFASCFFIGFAGLLRGFRENFSRWPLGAVVVCLLPGLLSMDHVEFFRVIQVMPLVLLVTAFGMQKLLVSTKPGWKLQALGLLLAAGFALDLSQYWKPRLDFSTPLPTVKKELPDENFRAFQVLKAVQSQQGPGLVFTDFLPLIHGHTLYVAVYPFNAVSNPGLDPAGAKWAAVITHWEYQPFLEKRFPKSRWFPVGKDLDRDEGTTLGIIPITNQNRIVFEKWWKAAGFFHYLQRRADGMFNNKLRYLRTLQELPAGYGFVQGDPFLESVYGEWLGQYYFGPSCASNAAALERAIRLGYPAAHLYRELGTFYFMEGRPEKGKEAYKTAARLGSAPMIPRD